MIMARITTPQEFLDLLKEFPTLYSLILKGKTEEELLNEYAHVNEDADDLRRKYAQLEKRTKMLQEGSPAFVTLEALRQLGKKLQQAGTPTEAYEIAVQVGDLAHEIEPLIQDTCLMCGNPATWVRETQFAGNHPFCDVHAGEEEDFAQEVPGQFSWHRIIEGFHLSTILEKLPKNVPQAAKDVLKTHLPAFIEQLKSIDGPRVAILLYHDDGLIRPFFDIVIVWNTSLDFESEEQTRLMDILDQIHGNFALAIGAVWDSCFEITDPAHIITGKVLKDNRDIILDSIPLYPPVTDDDDFAISELEE